MLKKLALLASLYGTAAFSQDASNTGLLVNHNHQAPSYRLETRIRITDDTQHATFRLGTDVLKNEQYKLSTGLQTNVNGTVVPGIYVGTQFDTDVFAGLLRVTSSLEDGTVDLTSRFKLKKHTPWGFYEAGVRHTFIPQMTVDTYDVGFGVTISDKLSIGARYRYELNNPDQALLFLRVRTAHTSRKNKKENL